MVQFFCLPAAFSPKKQDERRERTDKVWRGAWEAEDETWCERRFKQMWGVLRSKRKTSSWMLTESEIGGNSPFTTYGSNCKYCIKLWRHMTWVDNWIIKACLTKASAPPPIWKGMSKVCDLLHLRALIPLAGVGLPPQSASPSAVISSFHLQEGEQFHRLCQFYLVFAAARNWGRKSAPRSPGNAFLSSLWGSGSGLQSLLVHLTTSESGR